MQSKFVPQPTHECTENPIDCQRRTCWLELLWCSYLFIRWALTLNIHFHLHSDRAEINWRFSLHPRKIQFACSPTQGHRSCAAAAVSKPQTTWVAATHNSNANVQHIRIGSGTKQRFLLRMLEVFLSSVFCTFCGTLKFCDELSLVNFLQILLYFHVLHIIHMHDTRNMHSINFHPYNIMINPTWVILN